MPKFIKVRNDAPDGYLTAVHNINGGLVELKKGEYCEVSNQNAKSYVIGYGATLEEFDSSDPKVIEGAKAPLPIQLAEKMSDEELLDKTPEQIGEEASEESSETDIEEGADEAGEEASEESSETDIEEGADEAGEEASEESSETDIEEGADEAGEEASEESSETDIEEGADEAGEEARPRRGRRPNK